MCVLLLQELLQSCARGGGEESGGHKWGLSDSRSSKQLISVLERRILTNSVADNLSTDKLESCRWPALRRVTLYRAAATYKSSILGVHMLLPARVFRVDFN